MKLTWSGNEKKTQQQPWHNNNPPTSTLARVNMDQERSCTAVAVSSENRKPSRATILKPRKILAVTHRDCQSSK